jgi:hypothetical protein
MADVIGGLAAFVAQGGRGMVVPLVGNFPAGVVGNLGALNPNAGGFSMLTFMKTMVLGMEFVRRHRVDLGGDPEVSNKAGMVMGAVAHYIDEGRQPNEHNIGVAYTLLDSVGGLNGWAAGMLHPDRHAGFVNALSIGGASQETIGQVEMYLLDYKPHAQEIENTPPHDNDHDNDEQHRPQP